MKHTLFIVNPVSGRGAALLAWDRVRGSLFPHGPGFDEHLTAGPGEATLVTGQALAQGFERVVAVGGDGTLNEVLNGYLAHTGARPSPGLVLGLIPGGTGSDFFRSLLSLGLVETLTAGTTVTLDAARAEFDGETSRYFINLASLGLGGDAVSHVNRWRRATPRWVGGRARFVAGALRALGNYRLRRTTVRLDDRPPLEISTNFIVVGNGRFAGGGMMLAPNADLADGMLDVIVTDGASRLDVIRELPRIHRGRHLKNPKVTEYRASRIRVESSDPLALDLDGETAGQTPITISVVPSCVKFALIGRAG